MSSPSSSGLGVPPSARDEPDPLVGTVLSDRYRLDALLGEGGMGKVYAAEHVLMRKRLAVKILHRELTAVPEVVQRFEREARAAANIEHPNVAAATDFGKLADGSVFLVLEFVQGRNLRDEIAAGPMHTERALSIAKQIFSALAAAHALDIVHRDLKPENVMLIEKGNEKDFVKVLDFGIAKVPIGEDKNEGSGKPITKVGMVFGTPEYMAPEQALGQTVDGRADVYATGVILFEMLAGVRPFSSKSPVGILGQQLSKPPPSVAERVPGLFVPPAVEHLLQHLLAREIDERVKSAEDAAAAISALLGQPSAQGPRLFTMAAGSPAPPPPSSPNVGSIPDLEPPVPVLIAPDVMIRELPGALPSSREPFPSSPGSSPGFPSSPGINLEADLSEPAPVSAPGVSRRSEADRLREALDDLLARAREVPPRARELLARVTGWIDSKRPGLPPQVRTPLEKVPAAALLGITVALVAGLLLTFVVVVALLFRSPGKPVATAPTGSAPATSATVAPPSVERASDDELGKARVAGLEELAKLAERYPKDARVQLAIVKHQIAAKKHSEAVSTIGRVLGLDPTLNEDPEIASALWTTAQAKDSSEAAFAVLEGPMGARGAELIHDLASTAAIRPAVKQRAQGWLGSEAFKKNASPALGVLVTLEKATTCKARRDALDRAKSDGDARSLELLKSYRKKTGCGRRGDDDCYTCMRSDDVLDEAIKALEARVKK